MKIIRAQAVGNDGRSLFQPVKHLIQQHGLQMSEAVVEPDQDGRVMLVVENHGLEENCVLGCLQSVERILHEEDVPKKRQPVQFAISDWAMPQHFTSA